jgi:MOSC domain-containing protein YiiM
MRRFDELQDLWRRSPPLPRDRGTLRLICVRTAPGQHACPDRVRVSEERGLDGDRWSARPDANRQAQVTLMSVRAAELVAGDFAPVHEAGDNFLVDLDISEEALPTGARLRIGGVVLEISAKPHTGCNKFRDRFGVDALRWVNEEEGRRLRLRGVNACVVQGGEVALHDSIEVLPPAQTELVYERSSE